MNPGTCNKCGKSKSLFARGCCQPCYNRAYRKSRLHSAKDPSEAQLKQARKLFMADVCRTIRLVTNRTEATDSPAVWAERHLRLPPSKSYGGNGRLSWDISPDSVTVLDQLRNPAVHRICMAYSAQTGKSTVLAAALAWTTQVRGDSAVYALPSNALQRSVPLERIQPLFDLSRIPYEQKHGAFVFEGRNTLDFVLMTSRNQLAERSCRVVIVDEWGEIPQGLEFNPIADLEERTRLYPDWQIIMASTPKNAGGDVDREYASSRQHVIEQQCPTCQGWFTTELDDIMCSEDLATATPDSVLDKHSGYTRCRHCGSVLTDADHEVLVRGQRWRCVTPERGMRSLGYRKAIWHSVFKSYSDVVAKKLESQGDPMLWRQFMGNWCAMPIDGSVAQSDMDQMIQRGTHRRGEPPSDAIGYTIGADVGADEIWVSMLAFGPSGISQFFSERISRSRNDEQGVVRGFLHLVNDRPWSGKIPLMGIAVDCGFEQESVLRVLSKLPLAVGVKGDGGGMSQPWKQSSDGRMTILNHAYWQDYFQACLNNGTLRIPVDAYDWVEKHYRGEVIKTVTDPRTGMPKRIWALRGQHSPNHLRDASVYALFIGQQKGLCNIRRQSSQQLQSSAPLQKGPQSRPLANGFKRIPIRGVGKRERW